MNHFTPELFEQVNTDADPDRADSAWMLAEEDYLRRLAEVIDRLPPRARRFVDEECLHDAEVLGLIAPPIESSEGGRRAARLLVRQDDRLVTLEYLGLTESPKFEPACFPKQHAEFQPLWLYDELDVTESGLFVHRIFFNSGYLLNLTAADFSYSVSPIAQPREGLISTRPEPSPANPLRPGITRHASRFRQVGSPPTAPPLPLRRDRSQEEGRHRRGPRCD